MKKTAIASVTLAAALFAVSCQKETNPAQNVSGPMTISAVSEGLNTPTRTELAFKYDVLWSSTDKIYVVDGQGNHDTFSLQGGEGTTKGTFKQDGKTTLTGEVQAYYPATMLDGGSPVWPAFQTNDQTIPMYCKKTLSGAAEESMDFSSLGSVLQIVFNTTQENVTLKSIEIKDGSATLSGAFTVDTDGKAVITATDKAGITLDLGTGVALGKAANYFNIAVPAGNYQDLTLVFTATDGKKCTMTKGKVNIAYNAVGRLTLMGEKFKAVPLPGVFSVSATKKVRFSQGNLYYNGSKFDFEANQYEYHGYDSWGLFGWVGASSTVFTSSPEIYGVSTSDTKADYGNSAMDALKADWGTAIDDKGTWSTLSKDEWQYLLNTSARMDNGKACYSNAVSSGVTIGGVTYKGVFLYPDDYSGKEVVDNTETWTWDKIYSAGIVFLPAAGRRDGSDVYSVGVTGSYWSSTAYDWEEAWNLFFNDAIVSVDAHISRKYGFSVRLVTDASVTPAPTPTTTGTAKATIGGSEVDVNWVQLWEDGPKFAEYNVGVTDGKAESYGGYYEWADNIASSQWGSNWRMPTDAELQGLIDNCTVVWTTVGGKNGRKFTGKGAYASNSVFLPAAGYCLLYGDVSAQGDSGRYWSSTPSGSDRAYFLNFDSDSQFEYDYYSDRWYSVRAVLAE